MFQFSFGWKSFICGASDLLKKCRFNRKDEQKEQSYTKTQKDEETIDSECYETKTDFSPKNDKKKWLRIEAVLRGVAVGDSLGATSEFMIPWRVGELIEKYPGWPGIVVGGGKARWQKGAPTDDTEMMMAILRSIDVKKGQFDMKDVGEWFVAWMNSGPRDIGNCTAVTLNYLKRNKKDEDFPSCGGEKYYFKHPRAAANGSLMRNSVIPAVFHNETLISVIDKTVKHSIITHFGPLPVLCCVIHSYLIRNALQNDDPKDLKAPTIQDIQNFLNFEWKEWKNQTEDPICRYWLKFMGKNELKKAEKQLIDEITGFESYDPWNQDYRGRSGYCNLTLQIALWALHWSFRSDEPSDLPDWLPDWIFKEHKFGVIMWVVSIGADADTYGATAGGLLAAYHPEIAERFLKDLVVRPQITFHLENIKNPGEEITF